jgi:beta-mannosidase
MQKQRIDLIENWIFKHQDKDEWFPAEIPGCVHTDLFNNKLIDDPFYRTNEKKLQWIDKVNWEYLTKFHITTDILNRRHHRFVFEGLDTYADVYLNGEKILKADNMFRKWTVDLQEILKNKNVLKVIFRSPVIEDVPKYDALEYHLPAINDQSDVGELGDKRISVFARKAPYHYGWDWGPRFVTMGIWRPVYLVSWDDAIIESVHFNQLKVTEKEAKLEVAIEINSDRKQTTYLKISEKSEDFIFYYEAIELEKGNQVIAVRFEIKNPKLWWCNGLGEPYLYLFITELYNETDLIDKNTTSIGLRSLKVIREKDEKGRSFYFELNGKPVFAKGANYIPNDSFVPRVTHSKYEYIIRSAVDANMNMLRVWGGGIYENDLFYDLCDQYGIMIWQDFMFSCSMYPGDDAFLANVHQEINDNVKRLRNHASIAIWCGNNENDMIWNMDTELGWKNQFDSKIADKLWADYRKVFYKILPEILNELDPQRFYWPSSPLAGYDKHASYTTTSGDMHYWGVWHGKEPFEKYNIHLARFMSEYGFQSFPEFASVKKYTLSDDWDIDSEVMIAHQRSEIGNQLIKMYMNWDYHLPKNFTDMLYLVQVLQAEGMKIGMEAHRRAKPYCMGSLYWQINDCWPVASWSSIDYYGRWKALHYFAQKAFAPVLISPTLDNDIFRVFLISDLLKPIKCQNQLKLIDFNGNVIWESEYNIKIDANNNFKIFECSQRELLKEKLRNQVFLYCSCSEKEKVFSENCFYFDKIKNLDLPKPEVTVDVTENSNGYLINILSKSLAKNLCLNLEDYDVFFSDNYFDLFPYKKIQITCVTKSEIKNFREKLKIISVYDTYH